jgi:hypothetical protein
VKHDVTRLLYLCEPCAEGRGLEVDNGQLVTAVCSNCGKKTKCLVGVRKE